METDNSTVRIELPTDSASSIHITSTPSKNGQTVVTIQVSNALHILSSSCKQIGPSKLDTDGKTVETNETGVKRILFDDEVQGEETRPLKIRLKKKLCNDDFEITSVLCEESTTCKNSSSSKDISIERGYVLQKEPNNLSELATPSKNQRKPIETWENLGNTLDRPKTRSLTTSEDRQKRNVARSQTLTTETKNDERKSKKSPQSKVIFSPRLNNFFRNLMNKSEDSQAAKGCKVWPAIKRLENISLSIRKLDMETRQTVASRSRNHDSNITARLPNKRKISLKTLERLKKIFTRRKCQRNGFAQTAKSVVNNKQNGKSTAKRPLLRANEINLVREEKQKENRKNKDGKATHTIIRLNRPKKRPKKNLNYFLFKRRKVFVSNINMIKQLNLSCKVLLKPIQVIGNVNKNLNYRNALVEKLYSKNNPRNSLGIKTFDFYVHQLVTVLSKTKSNENIFLRKQTKNYLGRKNLQQPHSNAREIIDEEMKDLFENAVQKSISSVELSKKDIQPLWKRTPTKSNRKKKKCELSSLEKSGASAQLKKREPKFDEPTPTSFQRRLSLRKRRSTELNSEGCCRKSYENFPRLTRTSLKLGKYIQNTVETSSFLPIREKHVPKKDEPLSSSNLPNQQTKTSYLNNVCKLSSVPRTRTSQYFQHDLLSCVVLIKDEERAENIILKRKTLKYLEFLPKNVESNLENRQFNSELNDSNTKTEDVGTYRPRQYSHLFPRPYPWDLPFHLYLMYKEQKLLKRPWFGDRITGKIISSLDV